VLEAQRHGGEVGVLLQVGPLDQRAQLGPELLVGGAHDEVAVARLYGLVGRAHLVAGAQRHRRLARAPVFGHVPDRERHGRVEQRGVDVLALPRLLRADVGREQPVGGEQRAADVGHGHARLDRLFARIAGHAHHAGHGLGHEVEPRPAGPGAALAEAGDAHVDDLRVDLADGLVVDLQPLHHAGAVVLDDHVGRAGQLVEEFAALVAFQVERERALVAVHVQEAHAVRALHLEPHGAACLVAGAGRLHLDDIGAQVGQQHAGEGAGHDLAHVEHADALQRQGLGVWGVAHVVLSFPR
jgi:hypothetical protein